MKTWLSRNAVPIALVLIAAALVVGAFEVVDAIADSAPVVAEEGEAELTGLASLAGLIKVTIFLGVGALLVRPLRRRLSAGRDESASQRE